VTEVNNKVYFLDRDDNVITRKAADQISWVSRGEWEEIDFIYACP